MLAFLGTKRLDWTISATLCVEPTPADPAAPTREERKERREFLSDKAAACGHIWLAVDDLLHSEIQAEHDAHDSVGMWNKLQTCGLQKRPGARFNALDLQLQARLQGGETLMDFYHRVMILSKERKQLRPSNFDLNLLDEELDCFSLIHGLPDSMESFASTLLLNVSDSAPLSRDGIYDAFQTYINQQVSRGGDGTTPIAMRATSSQAPNGTEDGAVQAFSAALVAAGFKTCWLCDSPDHLFDKCPHKTAAREKTKASRQNRNRSGKGKAKDTPSATADAATASMARNFILATPTSLAALSARAKTDWNADTGCSTHMTPHRAWFRSYSPHRVPIFLADGSAIYSEGLGSVEFAPLVDGMEKSLVVLHDVLHVPNLASNLISVFDLMRNKSYRLDGSDNILKFIHGGITRFTATVNQQNIGYLDGRTIEQQVVHANAATTVPLDLALWHKRFSHSNTTDIRQMLKNDSVQGLDIKSLTAPDPICEPCIMGKMHRHSIPRGPAERRSKLLALVHSDVHGPLPLSREGFKYWITFIDDASRFRTVVFMRKKSDAFSCFLAYKAMAERQLGVKLLMLRDDKGGEYMGADWSKFCEREGILRQRTETAEPHQNGVAERANRDIAEGATTLLNEARLPAQWWPEAVTIHTHTTNRTATSTLDSAKTPYTLWKNKKPTVDYFRVFGCLAYVFIRKDKREPFGAHSRKCIFLGYAHGKKAWKFWDLIERKLFESSHAQFDERCFPGNSPTKIKLIPELEPAESPDSGGVVTFDDSQPPEHDSTPPPAPVHVPPPPRIDDEPIPLPDPVPAPPVPAEQLAQPPAQPQPQPPLGRPTRNAKPAPGFFREPDVRKSSSYPVATPYDSPAFHGHRQPQVLDDDSDSETEARVDSSLHALANAGIRFMLSSTDYLEFDEAMEYAFSSLTVAFKATIASTEPRSFREAMQRPEEERKLWLEAAHNELNALVRNGTFELVKLPDGRKAIGSRWVSTLR